MTYFRYLSYDLWYVFRPGYELDRYEKQARRTKHIGIKFMLTKSECIKWEMCNNVMIFQARIHPSRSGVYESVENSSHPELVFGLSSTALNTCEHDTQHQHVTHAVGRWCCLTDV